MNKIHFHNIFSTVSVSFESVNILLLVNISTLTWNDMLSMTFFKVSPGQYTTDRHFYGWSPIWYICLFIIENYLTYLSYTTIKYFLQYKQWLLLQNIFMAILHLINRGYKRFKDSTC